MLSTPRQLIKNCIRNSITAILIELRTNWGHSNITPSMIKKYRSFFNIRQQSSSLIPEAMQAAGAQCEFVHGASSLISQLTISQVDLAIAMQASTSHAYPIKRDYPHQGRFMAVNQAGTQLTQSIYRQLIDVTEVVPFYKVTPAHPRIQETNEEDADQLLEGYIVIDRT